MEYLRKGKDIQIVFGKLSYVTISMIIFPEICVTALFDNVCISFGLLDQLLVALPSLLTDTIKQTLTILNHKFNQSMAFDGLPASVFVASFVLDTAPTYLHTRHSMNSLGHVLKSETAERLVSATAHSRRIAIHKYAFHKVDFWFFLSQQHMYIQSNIHKLVLLKLFPVNAIN